MTAIPKQEAETELLSISDGIPATLSEADEVNRIIDIFREKVAEFPQDATTDKGRKAIVSLGERVRKSRIALEKKSKEYCDNLKKEITDIKNGTDELSKGLNNLIAEIRQPVEDYNKRENDRKQIINNSLAIIRGLGNIHFNATSQEIQARLDHLSMPDPMDWMEFKADADAAKLKGMENLRAALDVALKNEAAIAELAKFKALEPISSVAVGTTDTPVNNGVRQPDPPQAMGVGAAIPVAPKSFGFGGAPTVIEHAAQLNHAKEEICKWFRTETTTMNIEAIYTSIFLGEIPFVKLDMDAINRIKLGEKNA